MPVPHPRTRPEALGLKLSSSTRYVGLARIIVKLPTYARIVWGLMRDPRTPIGLKGMLAAALAYVVMPVDLIPDAIPLLGHADDLTVLAVRRPMPLPHGVAVGP